ncbi:MAG: tetratricopeptide repeat protein, partial [Gammaproteobacteria bacterium]|nr:tetratricopeptide repeat protein [Gammaproteobacteria bacterium]
RMAVFSMGWLAVKRLDVDDAFTRFSELHQTEPDDENAMSGLAFVYLMKNDHEECQRLLTELSASDPENTLGFIVKSSLKNIEQDKMPSEAQAKELLAKIPFAPFDWTMADVLRAYVDSPAGKQIKELLKRHQRLH